MVGENDGDTVMEFAPARVLCDPLRPETIALVLSSGFRGRLVLTARLYDISGLFVVWGLLIFSMAGMEVTFVPPSATFAGVPPGSVADASDKVKWENAWGNEVRCTFEVGPAVACGSRYM